MTDEERAQTIPLEVDLQSASSIADELLRQHPPYTGPKDSNPTVEQDAAYMLRRLAQRLRDMPEGERIEVWIRPEELEDLKSDTNGISVVEIRENEEDNGNDLKATLIIHAKEGESNE